jgi:hypothetical protein
VAVLVVVGTAGCQSISGVDKLFVDDRTDADFDGRSDRTEVDDHEGGPVDGDGGWIDRPDDSPFEAESEPAGPAIAPNPKRVVVLPISRDGLSADVFAILGDGNLYVAHRYAPDGLFLPFQLVYGAPPAPPYAPLAGTSRDMTHIDLLYVDNAGRVQNVSLDPMNGYRSAAVRSEPGAGGEGTAPPGTVVSVIKTNSERFEAFLADGTGTALHFAWSLATGWQPAVAISTPGRYPAGAPLTAVTHFPTQTMEVYGVGTDGFAWTNFCGPCDDTNWQSEHLSEAPTFELGTQLAAVSKDDSHEDVFGVDQSGRVWRAWWDTGYWWYDGFTRFEPFSSVAMLPAGATIAARAATIDAVNLMAVDGDNILRSEWWSDQWYPQQISPWGSAIDSAWQVWPFGTTSVNSVPVLLTNVGEQGALDVFWTAAGDFSRKPTYWTRRWTHADGWTQPFSVIEQ